MKEVPRAQLENWAKGAAVLHRYRKGEIVCTEGEFGSTAYYIVSGTVDISINNPLAHLRTRPVGGFFGRSVARMKSFLIDDGHDKRAEAHERKFIGIDANIDLPMNSPLAQLGAGRAFWRNDLPHFSAALGHGQRARAVRDGRNAARHSRHAGRQSPGLRCLEGDVER